MKRYMIEDSDGWYSSALWKTLEQAAQAVGTIYEPDDTLDVGMTVRIKEIEVKPYDLIDGRVLLAAAL